MTSRRLAIEIADLLALDKYLPTIVQIATEIPSVWLKTADSAALDRAMQSIRAGASVSGRLRPEESPNHDQQFFIVFISELTTESGAESLLEIARRKKPLDYCMMPLAEGRLFCLIVARSFVLGVEAFETQQTLTRFVQPIVAILHRHALADVTAARANLPGKYSASNVFSRLATAIRRYLTR